MKIFVLRDRSYPIDSEKMRLFHERMFHGTAIRNGKKGLGIETYWTNFVWGNDEKRYPLELIRTGNQIPDFFKPEGIIVISQKLKSVLEDFSNTEFLQVKFLKLIDFEWKVGDFSYEKKIPAYDLNKHTVDYEAKYVFSLRDCPALHKKAGKYYELIVPRNLELSEQYKKREIKNLKWNSKHTTVGFEGSVNQDIVLKNAIIRSFGGLILNAKAFKVIKPYIDWDFFECKEFDITK